jgi:hypothetical protein
VLAVIPEKLESSFNNCFCVPVDFGL